MRALWLSHNQLTGPIPEMETLSELSQLLLDHNQSNGPVPDLGSLANLTTLDVTGNSLCLPEGFSLSGLHEGVANHLESLNLPVCSNSMLS